ncbi:MAG: hypothetical protein AAGH89_01360 [Verrucomicrobiota bacterium]
MSNTEDQPAPPELPALGTLGLGESIDKLLKKPVDLLAYLQRGKPVTIAAKLFFSSLLCLSLFGFVVGLFAIDQEFGRQQLWAAPAKITGGLLFSGLICLPSLYIFSCLNGLDIRIGTTIGVMAASIALASLLLVSFAPVVWIFSQSTDSTIFLGGLLITFWAVALLFVAGLLFKARKILGGQPRGHYLVWITIFALVTFQMSTSLRPLVGAEEQLLPTEKKFFLQHWVDQINISTERAASRGWESERST